MAKYRKKPVVIEAVQLKVPMTVETLEGTMRGNAGDWLIIGVKGEPYFCKDDIFQETYEAEPVSHWLPNTVTVRNSTDLIQPGDPRCVTLTGVNSFGVPCEP